MAWVTTASDDLRQVYSPGDTHTESTLGPPPPYPWIPELASESVPDRYNVRVQGDPIITSSRELLLGDPSGTISLSDIISMREELTRLREELSAAQERINNLEQFKNI